MRRVLSLQATDGSPIVTSHSDRPAETKETAPQAMKTRSHPESREATRMEYRSRSESCLQKKTYAEEDHPDDEVTENGGNARQVPHEESKEEASLGEPPSLFFTRYSVSVLGSAIASQKGVDRNSVPLTGKMEETKEDPAVSKRMTTVLAGEYYMEDPPDIKRRRGDTPLILTCKSLSDSLTTAEESSLEEYVQLEEYIHTKRSSKHRSSSRDAIEETKSRDDDTRRSYGEGSVRYYMLVHFMQLFLVFLKCPASFIFIRRKTIGDDSIVLKGSI
jgi:hypothetical protein